MGIDALSNYGKDVGPKGGRGGTIALLLVVGLLGGAVLLYLFVPSVHSRVGSFMGQMRGTDALAAQEAAMKPKVQIIPQYPQVNKNLVTAKGAVDNISDEQLRTSPSKCRFCAGAILRQRFAPFRLFPIPCRRARGGLSSLSSTEAATPASEATRSPGCSAITQR